MCLVVLRDPRALSAAHCAAVASWHRGAPVAREQMYDVKIVPQYPGDSG